MKSMNTKLMSATKSLSTMRRKRDAPARELRGVEASYRLHAVAFGGEDGNAMAVGKRCRAATI
jgi:hypothetical protein